MWHKCTQDGCECKAKERATLNKHLAHIHDIGVVCYGCTQVGCEYKAKQRGHLKKHLLITTRRHDDDDGGLWRFLMGGSRILLLGPRLSIAVGVHEV